MLSAAKHFGTRRIRGDFFPPKKFDESAEDFFSQKNSTNPRRIFSPKKKSRRICGGLFLPKKNLAAAAANLDDPVFSEFKSRLSDFGCSSRGTDFLESTNPRRTFSQKNSTIPPRTFSQKKLNAAAGNLDDPVFSESRLSDFGCSSRGAGFLCCGKKYMLAGNTRTGHGV